jgi:hypothetical protein
LLARRGFFLLLFVVTMPVKSVSCSLLLAFASESFFNVLDPTYHYSTVFHHLVQVQVIVTCELSDAFLPRDIDVHRYRMGHTGSTNTAAASPSLFPSF